jgi:large subunit ribosomal protein L21
MKYAIIQNSGKQYIITPGKWYDIDYIKDGQVGDYISLNKILLIKKENDIILGKPFINNTIIYGKIIQQIKSKKITILKTKPKKNYTRTKGHRQLYTRLFIL